MQRFFVRTSNRLIAAAVFAFLIPLAISYGLYHYHVIADNNAYQSYVASGKFPIGYIPPDPSVSFVTPFTVFEQSNSFSIGFSEQGGLSLYVGPTTAALESTAIYLLPALENGLIWFIPLGLIAFYIRPKKA